MDILVVISAVIAIQLVLAFICGAMALGRDRDGAVWFLAGVFLGPLSIIALLFFGTPPQRR